MYVIQNADDDFWCGENQDTPAWSPNHALVLIDHPIHVPEGGRVREVWFRDEHPKWNASFVSEWDDGVSLSTRCVWDPENERVLEQETVDLDGVGSLERQYVIYEGEEFEVEDEDS
jgi:hypothetical protein